MNNIKYNSTEKTKYYIIYSKYNLDLIYIFCNNIFVVNCLGYNFIYSEVNHLNENYKNFQIKVAKNINNFENINNF